jgi:hypothetical protein
MAGYLVASPPTLIRWNGACTRSFDHACMRGAANQGEERSAAGERKVESQLDRTRRALPAITTSDAGDGRTRIHRPSLACISSPSTSCWHTKLSHSFKRGNLVEFSLNGLISGVANVKL